MATTLQDLPRISVVTPSYNQGEFLEATLRSVLTQDYPELEYVVIDGGSTDDSVSIIEHYAPELAYWVSEPDQGQAHALNKGFKKTTGEIMCWINSSDLYYPWTLHTVAEIFTHIPEVDWIMGVPSQFDVEGRPRVVGSTFGVNIYDVLAGDSREIQQESVFWRRALWNRAGGRLDQTLRCAGDFDLWLRFLRLTPLYNVTTLLAGFRVHGDRLGETPDGTYERELAQVYQRFAGACDRRSLARARLVRLIGKGKRKVFGEALSKAGVLPWYTHPHIVFDMDRMVWTIR